MPRVRSRRFLPPDPRTAEPYRLTPQVALRIAILGFVAIAVFAVLFLRLWALQVLSGDKYRAQANDNRVRTVPIDAKRGLILDRNGNVLVKNVLGWSLDLWPADLPRATAAREKELRKLSYAIGVPYAEIVSRIAQYQQHPDPLTPLVLRRGIHDDQRTFFLERELQFPGVRLEQSYLRSYPAGSAAAHVLGYVGAITEDELKSLGGGYKLTDVVGQAGVEQTYDKYLRGRDGTAQLTVNSRGQQTSPLQVSDNPQPGNNLKLTLDIGLQRAAEKALQSGIQLARNAPEGRYADGGAIVALNPNDGAILAMASSPTYSPSVFVDRNPKKLEALEGPGAAKHNSPLLNRAIDAAYPPGSTFKPVTALAAMEEHVLQPYTPLECTGVYYNHGQPFRNWNPYVDQWMDLPTALAESCDTYFYQLGYKFYEMPASDGHPLQEWASRFGLGATTGVDVGPEATGLVPTPEWRRNNPAFTTEIDRIWKPGYSIQLAIGQGDLLVTPLQMARVYAMIANGGNLVTPHLAEDVEQPSSDSGTQILRSFAPVHPTPTGVDPAALHVVQTGLWDATHDTDGTGYGVFGQFPTSISGKTGTAEKVVSVPGYPNGLKLNQSWWCGYGPSDHAQIVVCAMIENGGEGGSAAAPAALQMFEKYFHEHGTVNYHISD